ncbi:DUF5686 family protein [Zhouia sp. PK063]|uniref:DUF5686 and carboxypeptidase-like regulatory domain-containing protein n=1 Tax=Zhouia sp. PK063 TaxID=3373602 RepID=UPI0037912F25
MKSIISFLLVLLPISVLGQITIRGTVTDAVTGKPLPFSNVYTNTTSGTVTNANGTFELAISSDTKEFTVSYLGYSSKNITVVANQKSVYKIALDPLAEQLQEVVLTQKNEALEIIKKAIKAKKENDPEKKLNSFSFKTYSKLVVTANPDSINGAVDSLYKIENGKKQFLKVDSSNYELKKQLDRSHLYLTEKVSAYNFNQQKGLQETVLGTRMAGFKEALYEYLAMQLQGFSFYKDEYVVFGTEYTSPLDNDAPGKYNYRILDTLNTGRPAYMIYYYPKKKQDVAELEGVVYIDTATYAIQKGIAEVKGVIHLNAEQTFKYYPNEKVWFPVKKSFKAIKGDKNQAVSIFGGRIKFEQGEKDEDSTAHIQRTNAYKAEDHLYMISNQQNFDIQLNQPVQIKGRGLSIALDDQIDKRDETFWNTYRTEEATQRDKETYVVVDSILQAAKAEKRLKFVRKFMQGYFPTKYIDFDLRRLLKYNNYEGFRVGVGAITNYDFSPKYALEGYVVYGTKDKKFKYSLGASARLDKNTNTWLGAKYTDDLKETGSSDFYTDGRTFSLFEPRLFNITSFYSSRDVELYLKHDFTGRLTSRFAIEQSRIDPTFTYFFNNGRLYHQYHTTTATASFQWNPFSEYMQVKEGKVAVKTGFPQFTFQATHSFPDILDSDFDYTQLTFRTIYQVNTINNGFTSFLMKAGLAFGELPISALYHVSPNQPDGEKIMQRFSVAGRDSFETMFFNEFFSDKYVTLQGKHFFDPFKITNKIKPQLVLISRFALGDVNHTEKHIGIDFNSLNKGYFESGFEVDKIFMGFGLNFMYRYGAYHLPNFDDNISFKFTYYFSL